MTKVYARILSRIGGIMFWLAAACLNTIGFNYRFHNGEWLWTIFFVIAIIGSGISLKESITDLREYIKEGDKK